jgi:NAD(P)H-flavin reductase/hemoglobin-like flavoprotein
VTASRVSSADGARANGLYTASVGHGGAAGAESIVALIRESWARVEPQSQELAKHFYAVLFQQAPETRELFPVNMQVQRGRLLRAVVHVVHMVDHPDQLSPFLAQLGRDHRKFGVLARHYAALSQALISAVRHFSGRAWSRETEQAWVQAFELITGLMSRAAEAETGPASWLGRVIGHRRLSWDVAVVQVQTGAPIPYQAGQYLSVETPRRPRLWRYFSPANAPRDDGILEFHVRAVPDGWVSRAIVAHTQAGDTWRIGPPMGQLPFHRTPGQGLLLVAGGTGLAPIKAMLEQLAQQSDSPRTELFFGGHDWPDLYDLASLREMSYRNSWLNVIPVVECEESGASAELGTLADVITRYGAWVDRDVVVCGSPAMIRATVSRMLVAGTPLEHIHYDPFVMD